MTNTITNRSTGETITFLSNTPERLTFEDSLPANHPGVPTHYHAKQAETFTVLEGTFLAEIDGKPMTLTTGQSVTIPAGVPHRFHTRNSEAVKLRVELTPALDYETFFRSMAVAAEQNRAIPLQLAVMRQDLDLGFYIGGVPKGLQNALFNTLAVIARLLGYRARYDA
jgi:mannose-6-phosphate isomerase-like protein (cupin superfamily)